MKQIICYLKTLYCYHSDESDGDELFIKLGGKKIWPADKRYVQGSRNSVIPINLALTDIPSTGGQVILQLWDCDLITNDFLGEFIFAVSGDGQFRSDLRNAKTNKFYKYTLEFDVHTLRKNKTLL